MEKVIDTIEFQILPIHQTGKEHKQLRRRKGEQHKRKAKNGHKTILKMNNLIVKD